MICSFIKIKNREISHLLAINSRVKPPFSDYGDNFSEIFELTSKWFHTNLYLKENIQSLEYLKKRNISEDTRTSSPQTSNANLIIGGTTSGSPYVAFQLNACQFEFPQLATEDVISMSVNFVGQEPNATKGKGGGTRGGSGEIRPNIWRGFYPKKP